MSHPNISSKGWNRALYGAGRASIRGSTKRCSSTGKRLSSRLPGAARRSWASTITQPATTPSERAHLQAFCSFIEKSGLVDELRMISNVHASCGPSAKGYNGKSYAANQYDVNIARAHSKFAAA